MIASLKDEDNKKNKGKVKEDVADNDFALQETKKGKRKLDALNSIFSSKKTKPEGESSSSISYQSNFGK